MNGVRPDIRPPDLKSASLKSISLKSGGFRSIEFAIGRRTDGVERAVIDKQGRTIGAEGFGIRTHIDEDMGMIERRCCPHAHEFAGMDADGVQTGIIFEVRDWMVGHVHGSESLGMDHKAIAATIIACG